MIFDSGVGGLSVHRDIVALLPNIDVVYMYDNEGYPYGELEPNVLVERVVNCVEVVNQQYGVDAVVIACNSASTIALPSLRERFSFPIIGVVPALKPANLIAKQGITLLATPGTVSRAYTRELIEQFVDSVPVQLIGTTELVNMAEDKLRGRQLDQHLLRQIVEPIKSHSDVVVLGCTHFPLLEEELAAMLGEQVTFVDSGEAIARRVMEVLKLSDGVVGEGSKKCHTILSSAPEPNSEALERYLSKLNFSAIQHCPLKGA